MPEPLTIDVLILGGGIAGLWTLAHLRRRGYSCFLIESNALGAGQTIASQGIIHGGVKYALTGEASRASQAIARMPAIWKACLEGAGEVDLRSTRVLSDAQYLWTTPGAISRLAGFGASLMVRADSERQRGENLPEAFAGAPKGVSVYRVPELVLDSGSLVRSLAEATNSGGMLARFGLIAAGDLDHVASEKSTVVTLREHALAEPVRIACQAVVLTAGAGNAQLTHAFGARALSPPIRQQLRPLHMVMARGTPADIFGHCLNASTLPRITITTAFDRVTNERVWHIGGQIAEGEGVARDPASQIQACQRELRACLPWLDLASLRWATRRWDRAEGVVGEGNAGVSSPKRPDEPSVARASGRSANHGASVIVAWPTKLAFAPECASRIEAELVQSEVRPSGTGDGRTHNARSSDALVSLAARAPVQIARDPWDLTESASWM